MTGKNARLRLHINTDIILDEETYNVDFVATNIYIGNDGIGSYEFWGMKGNDRGHDFVEEFSISDLKANLYGDNLEEIAITDPVLLSRIADVIGMDEEIQKQLDEHFCSLSSLADYNDN